MSQEYLLFLQSLDDSQLVTHINSLSQRGVTSTPKQVSVSSDPFDDGLDDELLNMAGAREAGLPPRGLPEGARGEKVMATPDLLPRKGSQEGSVPVGQSTQILSGSQLSGLQPNQLIHPHSGVPGHVSSLVVQSPAPSPPRNSVDVVAEGIDPGAEEEDSEPDISLGEVGELHEFGDYGTYFENKRRKQEKYDDFYVEWERKRSAQMEGKEYPPIFKGCLIHVNGYTNPLINEIHRLVILYGGKFLAYLSRKGLATHIICDQLTPRKRIQFKNFKVVKTQWILDSIERGELQPWREYRLIEEISVGQQRLGFGESSAKNALPEDDPFVEEPKQVQGNAGQPHFDPQRQETMDAKHPEFLQHFFAHSRLHHLSTWKADLRLKFLRLFKLKPPRPPPPKLAPRVIFHIDFDCFFVTALAAQYPQYDLQRQVIVVTHGGKTLDIALCNYVARKHGIRNGMWLRQAESRCSEPIIKLDYNFDAYERISNQFYSYLMTLDLDTVFPVSIDEVLVDATSMIADAAAECGSAEKAMANFAGRIRRDVHDMTGCTVSVGAGPNVLLAKLSLRRAKPDGQFIFGDTDRSVFLSSVDVRDLPGIGKSICSRLEELCHSGDLKVVPHLVNLSKGQLTSTFGEVTGKKLFNYARGDDDTSIAIDDELLGRKSVSVDVNYGIRFDTIDQLDTFLMRIAEELAKRLNNLGFKGLLLTLRLAIRSPGADPVPAKHMGMGEVFFTTKSARLGVATSDIGVIGSELKALFRMVNTPINDLRGIAITMTRLIDALGKTNQAKLPFALQQHPPKLSAPATGEATSLPPPKPAPVLRTSSFDPSLIDWEVFDMLPKDIRIEIKHELERRGLKLESRGGSPQVVSKLTPLPQKRTLGSYQQLISPVKNVTAIKLEPSPTKKKRPVARPRPPPRPPSPTPIEFHTLVIEELPTEIREEFLHEVAEYNQRKEQSPRKQVERVRITDAWLSQQKRYFEAPAFYHQTSLHAIKPSLKLWVASSVDQYGPHEDDVARFEKYLTRLVDQGFLAKASLCVRWIDQCLSYQEAIQEATESFKSALEQWQGCIARWLTIAKTLR